MRLYHRTDAYGDIERDGFRDAVGSYLTPKVLTGVWFADRPPDIDERAVGRDVVSIDMPQRQFAAYEWIEGGRPYREFLVPAKVANRFLHTLRVEEER